MSSGGVDRLSMTAFRAVDRGFKSRPEHKDFRVNSPPAEFKAGGYNSMADDDMYHSRRMLTGYLGKLKAGNTEDTRLMLEFADLLMAQRLSSNRVKKYLLHLYVMRRYLENGFSHASTRDISRLVAWINSEDYTPNTKKDMLIVLKRFYQWLRAPKKEYKQWVR